MDSTGSRNTYKIQAGDTMESIAAKNGIPLDALKAANLDISNPDLIYPGKSINIPTALSGGSIPNSSTFQDFNNANSVIVGGGNAVSEQSKSPEESVGTGLTVPKPPKNSLFNKFKFF